MPERRLLWDFIPKNGNRFHHSLLDLGNEVMEGF